MKLKLFFPIVALIFLPIATSCVDKGEITNQSNTEAKITHMAQNKVTASKTIANKTEMLEFKLPIETLSVRIGDPIEIFNMMLSGEKAERLTYPDVFPDREDLVYPDLGFTIIFKEQKLSALYLYITQEGQTKFEKSCSYLGEDFWKNPNLDSFEKLLLGAGFERETSKSGFHKVMAKNDIRYVYIKRPDTEHIYISRSQ